jgi:hypothetical protein
MQFFLTLGLLALGSGLVTFRFQGSVNPYRDHIGFILLLYGFGNFLLFLLGDFLPVLREQPTFGVLKLSLWVVLMVIGFVLAYPLLERQLFRENPALSEQGRRVFEGFNGLRPALGFCGLALCIALLLSQWGLL